MDRYKDELLSEAGPENTYDKEELAWKRTGYAIRNFLRGWIINVSANHDHAKYAEILLDGLTKKN